jgi:hypothetical protein
VLTGDYCLNTTILRANSSDANQTRCAILKSFIESCSHSKLANGRKLNILAILQDTFNFHENSALFLFFILGAFQGIYSACKFCLKSFLNVAKKTE